VISRRFKTAVIAGGTAGLLANAGFAPVVRYEASQAAARYGGKVSIDRVFPAWRGARLRGVDVTLEDIPSTTIHLDEVDVRFGGGGRTIDLRGGLISTVGSRELVLHEADAWRARHQRAEPQDAAPGSGGSTKTTITGLNLSWKNDRGAPTEAVSASGVTLSRDGDRLSISASDASVVLGRVPHRRTRRREPRGAAHRSQRPRRQRGRQPPTERALGSSRQALDPYRDHQRRPWARRRP
jgi:hypothetical protein